eukprot:3163955-Rhodomonas_salina.1
MVVGLDSGQQGRKALLTTLVIPICAHDRCPPCTSQHVLQDRNNHSRPEGQPQATGVELTVNVEKGKWG